MQQNNILGKALYELINILMQIKKETDPEGYEKFMKRNEQLKKQRLLRETKANKKIIRGKLK